MLVGDISIGSGTIVHPFARIISKTGPVVIGDNNIIEEMAEIVNDSPEPGERDKVMIIGSGNLIGVAASVSSLKMGNSNTVEAGARLGRHTVLPYGCVLTPGQGHPVVRENKTIITMFRSSSGECRGVARDDCRVQRGRSHKEEGRLKDNSRS